MANLPDDIQWDVETFARGVIMGSAPYLEKHTETLYKAFAPLRAALGTVTMYRGEPLDPPKIKRKWLSWTTDPRMAGQFAGKGSHIIEARIPAKDVVAGIVSPHNENYIEYLVRDRPEYHQPSPTQVPLYNFVMMQENHAPWPDGIEYWKEEHYTAMLDIMYPNWKQWLQSTQKAVAQAGGKTIKVREPDYSEDEPPVVSYVLPPGQELPPPWVGELEEGTPMPKYLGKLG